MSTLGYLGLFGEAGNALGDWQWVAHANANLVPNLAALNTRFLDGSRAERTLRVGYEPGPTAMALRHVSGGTIAEMLDQAATHCASFVTGYPCPTVTLTVNYLRAGLTPTYTATARVLQMTSAAATVGAELVDADGLPVATLSLVGQFIKNLERLK